MILLRNTLAFSTLTLSLSIHSSGYFQPIGYSVPAIRLRADSSVSLNLPPHTLIGLDDPLFLDNQDIIAKFLSFGGEEDTGILRWSQDEGLSTHIISPNSYASGLSLEPNTGDIIFEQLSYAYHSEGIIRLSKDLKNPRREFYNRSFLFTSAPQGLLGSGDFVVREQKLDDESQGLSLLSFKGEVREILSAATRNPLSPYSYLFPHQVLDDGRAVIKVRHGKAFEIGERQADEILLLKISASSATKTRLLADSDLESNSDYLSFDNSGAINDAGDVAWIVRLKNGRRALIHKSADAEARVVAEESRGEIREIQYFRPSISSRGDIIFRAKDTAGREGVWRADTGLGKIYPVLRENDRVKTDRGAAFVGVKGDFPGVIFMNPQMNRRGDILVGALLRSEETGRELGLGYFVVEPMQ